MVRNPYTPNIKLVHPRFYFHQCVSCKIAFKNEDMWRLIEEDCGIDCELHIVESYCCTECADTKEKATKLLMNPRNYKNFKNVERKIKARIPIRIIYE